MLLIDCPYCGERPEPEFVYGGQAHIVRPAQAGGKCLRKQWADYLYRRGQHPACARRALRHTHGCGALFSMRCANTTTDHFLATYKVGEPPPTTAAPVPR